MILSIFNSGLSVFFANVLQNSLLLGLALLDLALLILGFVCGYFTCKHRKKNHIFKLTAVVALLLFLAASMLSSDAYIILPILGEGLLLFSLAGLLSGYLMKNKKY